MGDRTSVTLTVPTIYKDAAMAVFAANEASPEDSFENGGGVNAQNPHNLHCFCFYEVNYGTLQFLDDLMKAGIPFDSDWGSGSEYGPGCETCRFTDEGEAIRKEVSDDSKNPDLKSLMDIIDDHAALKRVIEARYEEVTSLPWDNQIENSKRYRLKQLIKSQEE